MTTEPKPEEFEAKLEKLVQAKIDAGDADVASMTVILQVRQLRLLRKILKQLFFIERGVGSVSAGLFAMAQTLHCDDRVRKAWMRHSKETDHEWDRQKQDFGLGGAKDEGK
jgi:hypothetical protein